ncbi:uncharacterized protein C2orf73 homolog, partial [Psammomys obesus]|uniref:uncharacterized protein C2orf73 homolog n=1 Tax=Psammomys obesus TaxID=48139 RepID=UPI0024532212
PAGSPRSDSVSNLRLEPGTRDWPALSLLLGTSQPRPAAKAQQNAFYACATVPAAFSFFLRPQSLSNTGVTVAALWNPFQARITQVFFPDAPGRNVPDRRGPWRGKSSIPLTYLDASGEHEDNFVEYISFIHQYDARKTPCEPIRGKRHGTFIQRQITLPVVSKEPEVLLNTLASGSSEQPKNTEKGSSSGDKVTSLVPYQQNSQELLGTLNSLSEPDGSPAQHAQKPGDGFLSSLHNSVMLMFLITPVRRRCWSY